MNESQLKTKILFLRAIDMILLLSVIAMGIWGFLYSDIKEIMMLATLIGLFVVNKIGNYNANKVGILRMDLKKLQAEAKKFDF